MKLTVARSGPQAVNPRKVLRDLGVALHLDKEALPVEWSDLNRSHDETLSMRLPLTPYGWDDVVVLPYSTRVRTDMWLSTPPAKSPLARHWRDALDVRLVPILAMDAQAPDGASGVFMIMPLTSMDSFMRLYTAPMIVNPTYLGGSFCFSVRSAVDNMRLY